MKFLEGYQIAQRITSTFEELTCKMDGQEPGEAWPPSAAWVIPEKSWLGCPGCHHWTLNAPNRTDSMSPKPSLLLCIISCRFKDSGRSIQVAELRARPVPQLSETDREYLTFQLSCRRAKPCLPWNSHHSRFPKHVLVAMKYQSSTANGEPKRENKHTKKKTWSRWSLPS